MFLRRCRWSPLFADGVRRQGWPHTAVCCRPANRTTSAWAEPAGNLRHGRSATYRAITQPRWSRATALQPAFEGGRVAAGEDLLYHPASWTCNPRACKIVSTHSPPGLRLCLRLCSSALPSALPSVLHLLPCPVVAVGSALCRSRRARGGKISRLRCASPGRCGRCHGLGDATSAASRSGRPVR